MKTKLLYFLFLIVVGSSCSLLKINVPQQAPVKNDTTFTVKIDTIPSSQPDLSGVIDSLQHQIDGVKWDSPDSVFNDYKEIKHAVAPEEPGSDLAFMTDERDYYRSKAYELQKHLLSFDSIRTELLVKIQQLREQYKPCPPSIKEERTETINGGVAGGLGLALGGLITWLVSWIRSRKKPTINHKP
jgi:hypothetical protein